MIQRILVATDFSNLSRRVLLYGAEVAHKTGASLILVHGIDLPRWMEQPDSPGEKAVADMARKRLEQLSNRPELEKLSVQTRVFTGPVEIGIQKLAGEMDVDLVLVAKHGRNVLESFFLGSVTEKILRNSNLPVLVLSDRGIDSVRWSRIVCAVDSSSMTDRILHYAARLSRMFGEKLTILHVADLEPDALASVTASKDIFEQYAREKEQELRGVLSHFDQPAQVKFKTRQGKPYTEIILATEEEGADLLIVGARGDWVEKGMGIGSTARAILQNATFPVLVYPG